MTVFFVDDKPGSPNSFVVRVRASEAGITYSTGSFNVLGARITGLSWANYLRLLRDEFHGTIYGKNCYYPYVVFDSQDNAARACQYLNKLAKNFLAKSE